MTLKVYLIRHGETDFNKQNKDWGQDDKIPLNDHGIEQSKNLSKKIKKIKFDKIFSSDRKRAKQTAEIITQVTGYPIIEDKRLREYSPGEVDPSSDKWAEKYKQLLNSGMSKYDIRPFGGENIWDLIKRVKSFIEDIQKEKGTIALIAHSGANGAIINVSQKREKTDFLNIKQDNVCINILEFSKGEWKIKTLNDSSHISNLKPKKRNYENQDEIKQLAKAYILDNLNKSCKEIYLAGDIIFKKFGLYDRVYKRYDGSTIETYVILKNDFKIPQEWKVSLLTKNIQKYEIGKIKVNDVKHKINVTLISDSNSLRKKKVEKIL